jgi:hypothetical protein
LPIIASRAAFLSSSVIFGLRTHTHTHTYIGDTHTHTYTHTHT